MRPRFSIVIPTYERPELLAGNLGRLTPDLQRMSADAFEILVSDDGSRNPAEQALAGRFPYVRWIKGPRRGPASNRNAGAAAASGEWLVFLDDDTLPGEGWLAAYAAVAQHHPDVQVMEGRTVPERERRSAAEYAPIVEQGGKLWSCNLALRRDVFERIGGFEERFRTAMEDNDLAFRLRASGIRSRFVPEATIIHPWREKRIGRDGWKTDRGYLDDMLLYLTLHPGERRILTPRRIALLALRTFRADTHAAVIRFRGRGWTVALACLVRDLRIAWLVHRHFRKQPLR